MRKGKTLWHRCCDGVSSCLLFSTVACPNFQLYSMEGKRTQNVASGCDGELVFWRVRAAGWLWAVHQAVWRGL